MFPEKVKNNFSLIVIALLLGACVWNLLNEKKWNRHGIMVYDVGCYYGYLPKAFNYKTDEFYTDHQQFPEFYSGEKYVIAENGNLVLKTTMGMAVLYFPFYLIGMLIQFINFGNVGTGYEVAYRMMMHWSGICYLLAGVLLLRKLLLRYFSEAVTGICIMMVALGTNMFYYTVYEGCMTHVSNFALYLCFIWLTIKWYEDQTWARTVLLGLLSGLLSLIRPTNALIGIVFLLYNVYDMPSLRARVTLLLKAVPKLMVVAAAAVVVWIPQMLYWKELTGQFFFYSYVGERFFFDRPRIQLGLLSWRKGWLIYTPLGWLMFAGFFFLKKYVKEFFLASVVFTSVFIYVIFSWWCWWYGGGYSIRAMIDIYCILALPLAALTAFMLNEGRHIVVRISYSVLLVLVLALSVFQTYQYKRGTIHYDSMTKEAYCAVFLKLVLLEDSYFKAPPNNKLAAVNMRSRL